MIISINWLKELVDFKENAKQIAEILTDLGLESNPIDTNNISVEITANRGDCLSILGIARELSAKLNSPLKLPDSKIDESEITEKLSLNLSDEVKKLTPRFSYRIISDIKIGPSTKEIVEKIESYGFRSINNVVDITNLIMIELGQPMHAFDFDKLKGELKLRLSKDNEKIITLDGKEHTLKEGSLVGESNGKLVDLVGIMGGFYSEVDASTKTIVLQAAIFDPVNIRKTSKYLNHTTDASYRYERGVDQAITIESLNRAANLILQTCNAKVGKIENLEFAPIEKRKIVYNVEKINALLGVNFSQGEIKQSLEKLGFTVEDDIAFVPSWRLHDIYIWQDLAEEVLRLNGYDKLKAENLIQTKPKDNSEFTYKESIKDKLINLGFSETLSYSFISRKDLEIFSLNKNELTKIEKPLSLDFEYFRPALYINVLKQIAKNPWFSSVLFFEIGHTILANKEEEKLIVMVADKDGCKILEEAIKTLRIETKIIEIDSKITANFKIKKPVHYFETELPRPENQKYQFVDLPITKAKMPSAFPPAQIDLAFIAAKDLNSNKVELFLNNQENVVLAELFDEFESDKFGKDKKNIAYHLWIEKSNTALSEKEIAEIRQKIIDKASIEFSLTLR